MIIIAAKASELGILDEEVINDASKIIITGVGGINAIRKILQNIDPTEEEALNVGYAGSNILPIGEKFQISATGLHHPGVEYREKIIQLDQLRIDQDAYPCYTSTDFVTQTNIKEPALFDMELAFIAALGWERFYAIKQVSDNLNLKQYEKEVSK